jgi:hypothetical protein
LIQEVGFKIPRLQEARTNATSDLKGASALDLDLTEASTSDFLSRERAALGDDATLFASGNDNAAFVEDGDDDLLGGGGRHNEEIQEFQSSFPAIDMRNDVRNPILYINKTLMCSGYGPWRHYHWQHLSIFLQCSFR